MEGLVIKVHTAPNWFQKVIKHFYFFVVLVPILIRLPMALFFKGFRICETVCVHPISMKLEQRKIIWFQKTENKKNWIKSCLWSI